MRRRTFLFLTTTAALAATAAGGYHVTTKFQIGGEGGWDYATADSDARRLYVSHGTQVEVLDLDSGTMLGSIPDTPGVHGIAVAPDLNRGFVSAGRANKVKIFDGRTGSVDGTIQLGGRPEFAAADGAGHVYVNLEDKSAVVRIDSQQMIAGEKWPLKPCEEPSGMAIDAQHHRLFIGCSNKMMAVMNAENGKVIATLPIGQGVDANGFDPGTGLAFSSNGEGTLTVVHEDTPGKFKVVENVKTQRGARTMALDLKTHNVLLPVADFGPAPEATAEQPHPRPAIMAGSFAILVVGQ